MNKQGGMDIITKIKALVCLSKMMDAGFMARSECLACNYISYCKKIQKTLD